MSGNNIIRFSDVYKNFKSLFHDNYIKNVHVLSRIYFTEMDFARIVNHALTNESFIEDCYDTFQTTHVSFINERDYVGEVTTKHLDSFTIETLVENKILQFASPNSIAMIIFQVENSLNVQRFYPKNLEV